MCNVRYSIIKHKTGSKYVKKVKDLSSCDKRTLAHSNIETVQYKQVSLSHSSLCLAMRVLHAGFCLYFIAILDMMSKIL